MTPQEQKELEFITKQATKAAIGIVILVAALLIISSLI